MTARTAQRQRDPIGVAVLATGLVYYALAVLMWRIEPSWGSAFWPVAGVTFAAFVRLSSRAWPALVAAIGVAEVAADLQFGTSLTTALLGAAANIVEPVAAATIFCAVVRARRVDDVRSLWWCAFAGAVVGPAVGACFGGLLVAHGPDPAVVRWLRWGVGDGVGVLAVAPALLVGRVVVRARFGEAATLAGCLAVVGALFVVAAGPMGEVAPYLAVPLLVWAALRFGVVGAACATTGVAVLVHAATAVGRGPFAASGASGLVVAQTYIGVVALSTLTVALLVEDVAHGRRTERALLHRALHDALTGLPNRAMLDERLAAGDIGAVLVVDLDGFKAVNDTLGHGAGDVVLREVARRLQAACRPGDLVARAGGDEFVVVLAGAVADCALDAAARRLEAALAPPIAVAATEIQLGATVGAARSTENADPDVLLATADRRMYASKHARRRALAGRRRLAFPAS